MGHGRRSGFKVASKKGKIKEVDRVTTFITNLSRNFTQERTSYTSSVRDDTIITHLAVLKGLKRNKQSVL